MLRRDASSSPGIARSEIKKTVQTLMDAAERFVNSVRRSKKTDLERHALLDAITQAQWLLSVERSAAKRPAWMATER